MKVLNFFKICGVSFFILLSPVGLSQSKQDVSLALDQMQASGSFSHEQIDAARKQLMNMDESSYMKIVNKAQEKSRDPAFQQKALEYMGK